MARQTDLFDTQADLFGPAEVPSYLPDPAKVRAELLKLLGEAKAATVLPWRSADARLYRTVFPQMANWLPEDEARQLRFAFEAELERLLAA